MFAAGNSAAAASAANYIEDVFSTYLYTGTSAAQTITNGINLATNGGLVWTKSRSNAISNINVDTVRGGTNALITNLTNANSADPGFHISSFNSNGYSLQGAGSGDNFSGYTYASWTFRKQPKFFDVVTFTSPASGVITVNHNLGSIPGCVITKATGISQFWIVNHRSLLSSEYLVLNATDAKAGGAISYTANATTVTFSAGYLTANTEYVMYLFAHNAGGFGLTDTDNVISCGTFTTDGTGAAGNITLGYEAQWLLIKRSDGVGSWNIIDVMRGSSLTSYNYLQPNASTQESSSTSAGQGIFPTATGFFVGTNFPAASANYIYIAIRRGPMKVPTLGTSVFSPNTYTGTGATLSVSGLSFPPDMVIPKWRSNGGGGYSTRPGALYDKLRGSQQELAPTSDAAESTQSTGLTSFNQSGFTIGTSSVINSNLDPYISWNFRRAPGFFDVVCYTGTGSATTITHNLTVIPELMIIKKRNSATNGGWLVGFYVSASTGIDGVGLNDTAALSTRAWSSGNFNSAPTASVFGVGSFGVINALADTYVAYLFATAAGVSKVGSYTGTGALQTVACGFTSGARYVLIKRTDSTGDWYVWDSARGITSGNDPYLLLNSTAAEVTSTNYVDTDTTGFKVTAAAPAALNAVGGTYIFLAIA